MSAASLISAMKERAICETADSVTAACAHNQLTLRRPSCGACFIVGASLRSWRSAPANAMSLSFPPCWCALLPLYQPVADVGPWTNPTDSLVHFHVASPRGRFAVRARPWLVYFRCVTFPLDEHIIVIGPMLSSSFINLRAIRTLLFISLSSFIRNSCQEIILLTSFHVVLFPCICVVCFCL